MRCSLLCLALASIVVPSSGCDEPITCSTEGRPSVVLSVVDAESGDDVDATVTYRIDGEEPIDPVNQVIPGEYQLGVEQDGTFEVTVSADGYAPVTQEYEVTADECHVTTVEATIELTPTS